ncbi:cytochrome c3 family protein [Shewanella sp. NIFS-20-20]|uniref:cytochrome c3 family protein n=1 Tax=Shewanella sp. NIFS-20-20 TaxID=2853806 RepID=UPI001C438F72|nr:cytochrome c3 family protein [Shewanella sp. NIFS-20-20]MBV7316670.1 cytochrome c3 family protein [Shewanella sp. NIFS-20-20]
MLKTIIALLVFSSFSVAAANLADSHTEMSGCEACHQNGEPSTDMAFELEQCQSCHGDMKEIAGENHQIHEGVIGCNDCHISHEEVAPETQCQQCH